MKALVVYYSQTGNTEKVARQMAQGLKDSDLEAEVVSIEPSKEKDYQTNVEEAKEQREAEIEPMQTDLRNYGLVCLGTPVWSSAPATPVNGWLGKCENVGGTKILCFATHGGGGPGETFEIMRSKLQEKGGKVVKTLSISSRKVSTGAGLEIAKKAGEELARSVK